MAKTVRLLLIFLVCGIIFGGNAWAGSILGLSGNLAFSLVTVNSTKTTTMTISNTGTSPLTVSGITYPDGFTGNWSSGTITAGSSQNVTVTFSPTAVQAYSGTVTVASDMTSGTNTATISGSGTAVPSRIIALLGNMTFGNVTVNSAKASTLTISNAGNSALSIGGITLPSGFVLGNTYQGTNNIPFPSSIAANSAADVTVLFRPTAVQAYAGNLTVNSDMTSGTNTASISGTGTLEPSPYGNFRYSDNGQTITITGYVTNPVGGLAIPISIGDKPVTSIGDYAFYGCTGLTSVTMPASVTSIGSSAFQSCNKLTSVTIPSSVTSIGDSAFSGCSGLTSVMIPSGVTSIGSYAFYGCSGLTSVTIPSSVTSIGSYAFYGCSGLTSVTIPSSVTSIGDSAFSGCRGLTSVTIPFGVTSIGVYAFQSCDKLTSVTISSSVISIGRSAFSYCSGLASISVDISNPNYSSIAGVLFDKMQTAIIQCPSGIVGAYEIPSGVTSIGDSAFQSCSKLTSVTIPAGVTSIGSYAFSSCSGLTSVTIPSSVTSIGNNVFTYCSGLATIMVDVTNSNYSSTAGVLFDKLQGTLIKCPSTMVGAYEIPPSVISIGDYAFDSCYKLTSVTFPVGVTSIGNSAFSNCSGLTSVTIPSGVTSIGSYAFQSCSKLTSVTIPSSVANIGNSAFSNCSGLTSATIQSGVMCIGSSAFYSCSGLTSVTIPAGVTSIGNSAFSSCSGLTSVTIPAGVTSIGNSAFSSCSGLTSVTIPSSVTSIGNNAFSSCSNLTSLSVDVANLNYSSTLGVLFDKLQTTLIQCPSGMVGAYEIPSGVTSIGYSAFQSCSKLTSVTIPASVTSIGSYAFSSCSGLTSVTIPSSVTSIGSYAFRYCSKLTSISLELANPNYSSTAGVFFDKLQTTLIQCPSGKVGAYTIPSSVTSIANSAFSNCSGLTSVTIPSSVTSIGDSAFSGCSGLASVMIPSGVTSIGSYAFQSCSKLTGVTIPSSVTSIANSAFSNCSGLTSVTIQSGVISIGDSAFQSCSKLTSVTIPSGVTSIGSYAFYGCSGLTSVTIPSSVTSIRSSAFQSCSKLTSVTIPSNVTSIGNSAFSSCSGLTNAQFDGDAPAMGSSVFASVASGFTVKYHNGAIGFTSPTWNGYPAMDIGPLPTRIIGVSGNLTFGSVTVNSSAANTLMIGNTGNLPLTVTSITYPTGFSGNWAGGAIAAGLTQNVTVTFSPTALQAYGGTVSVSSDSTSGTGTIAASGQGVVSPTPYATWLGTKFTPDDILAGQTTMTVDFDNDRMANLLEYAFGTDPKTSNPSPLTVDVIGSNLQISFPCDVSCTDISYIVQASSDLVSWTDIAKSLGGAKTREISSSVSDEGTGARTVWVTDSTSIPAGGKRFLRLKIVNPAQ